MDWTSCLSVLVAILALHSVSAQNEPEITRAILPDIKRVGETGKLNCTVTRQGNNKVYWIYKNTANPLVITSNDNVDLEKQYNPLLDNGAPKFDIEKSQVGDWVTYTLIIRRLELTDAGQYECQVLIRGQENSPSKSGYIIVQSPPTIVLYTTTQVLSVNEGENALLTCDATGYPTPKISWVRPNGKAIPPPINHYTYMGRDLNLTNVRKDDRGVYRCIADNDVRPPAMFDATLYVRFRPFARPVQDTYGQAANRQFDIVIECRVEGFPDPDLRWYQVIGDDENEGLTQITDDDKHVIHILISHGQALSVSEFWFQLKILNVQANDYGEYVCEGSNQLGNHQARVTLYETSECQGPNCPPQGAYIAGVSRTLVSLSLMFAGVVLSSVALL